MSATLPLPWRHGLLRLIALPLMTALSLPACASNTSPAAGKAPVPAAKTTESNRSSGRSKTAVSVAPRAAAAVLSGEAPDEVIYGSREDVVQFAQQVAERHQLDATWVREQLAQARYLPSVARLIMPPPAGTAKNWTAYRARFIDPTRIRAGAEFWRQNASWLQQAEARYGVPAEIVVGIIGVETLYGRHMGNFRLIDALATLSFDFPAGRRDRSEFFRSELDNLFVLAHAQGIDATSLRGSYAGAVGLPQFMPSSWNKYAVDFDRDGRIDLRGSVPDAIGSVANYLAKFGWQAGMPTHFQVKPPVDTSNRAVLLAPDILPTFTAAEFAARGAELDPQGQRFEGKLALVEMQNGDAAPSYFAWTENAYAISRYNWSAYYTMAVIDLGREVRAARERDL